MNLTKEQLTYAVTRFQSLYKSRDMKQDAFDGAGQGTVSKVLAWSPENQKYSPSADMLEKLFRVLGFKLPDILTETDEFPRQIIGYLATPLTGLTSTEDEQLLRVVEHIRQVVADDEFADPPFSLYWPGDHTHPKQHASISPEQVYLTDRTHASMHDFVILFCGSPSFGVGQENEIATQAGVRAIRLIPLGLSRMMLGSFISTHDIIYSGSLESGIEFDVEMFRKSLREVRQYYFRIRAFYRGINGDAFGQRLRKLIDSRCAGDFPQFAADIGISHFYLQKLVDEPFTVSNPSSRLLLRMAHRLGERVGFLLGESEETDAVWIQSNTSWRAWIDSTPGIEASVAVGIRDDWRNDYAMNRREKKSLTSSASFRNTAQVTAMKQIDWDKLYQASKRKAEVDAQQPSLGL
jgi:hypothetical protein